MSNDRRLLLVVEDDADVAGTLTEFLEDEGFSVTVAQNGKQALEQLRAGLRPVAILLDLLMPRWTDGSSGRSRSPTRTCGASGRSS